MVIPEITASRESRVKNDTRTCPGCGNRKRRPEKLFCWRCYQSETEDLPQKVNQAIKDRTQVPSLIETAMEEGKKTLQRLQTELKEAEKEKDCIEKPFWHQAKQDVRDAINYTTDHRSYGNSVRLRFQILWEKKYKNETPPSKKTYSLKKRVECLEQFLEELKQKNLEYEAKINSAEIAEAVSPEETTVLKEVTANKPAVLAS